MRRVRDGSSAARTASVRRMPAVCCQRSTGMKPTGAWLSRRLRPAVAAVPGSVRRGHSYSKGPDVRVRLTCSRPPLVM